VAEILTGVGANASASSTTYGSGTTNQLRLHTNQRTGFVTAKSQSLTFVFCRKHF